MRRSTGYRDSRWGRMSWWTQASERVLIDNIPSYSGNHIGGDLGFGKDGYLYVGVGDGGCDYGRDSGCANENDAARDQHVLLGKILRITRTGGIPPTNPYRGAGTARCAHSGRTQPGKHCRETYASGLRNPFRFAFDPAADRTRLFVNDTGEQGWEEVDLVRAGADYGWNLREGHCRTGDKTAGGKGPRVACGRTPRGLTDPVFDYSHADGCGAISGGTFVPPGIWPARFRGGYLVGDYNCGKIRLRRPGARRVETFVSRSIPVIDMVFGPYEDTQALYYSTWNVSRNVWAVRVIAEREEADSAARCGRVEVSLILLGLVGVPYLRRRARLR